MFWTTGPYRYICKYCFVFCIVFAVLTSFSCSFCFLYQQVHKIWTKRKKNAPKHKGDLMAVLKYERIWMNAIKSIEKRHMAVWDVTVLFHTSTSTLLGSNVRQTLLFHQLKINHYKQCIITYFSECFLCSTPNCCHSPLLPSGQYRPSLINMVYPEVGTWRGHDHSQVFSRKHNWSLGTSTSSNWGLCGV